VVRNLIEYQEPGINWGLERYGDKGKWGGGREQFWTGCDKNEWIPTILYSLLHCMQDSHFSPGVHGSSLACVFNTDGYAVDKATMVWRKTA
jgi:hypothetical protein